MEEGGRPASGPTQHNHGAEDTRADGILHPLITAGRRPLPEALLAYAEAGLAVFPLPPRMKHWTGRDALDYRHATTDPAELHRLIAGIDLADTQTWPNIAMQPGRSGLIAVDLDGEAGMESWAKAAADAGGDPWATLGYRTPREDGGVRLLYRAPAELRFGKRIPLPGVEVFGTVGHVVLPPSIHPNGKPYAWTTEGATAVFPPFAVAMLGPVADGPDEATDSATNAEVEEFLASLPNVKVPSQYAARALDNLLADLRRAMPGLRHPRCVHAVARVLELAVDGKLNAGPALDQLAATFAEVLANERDRLPAAEFAGILRWSVAKVRRDQGKSKTPAPPSTAAGGAASDGAALLDDVRAFMGRFAAFPDGHALTAVTLWAAHAHLVDALDSSPRLALLSPEPSSGKTRTLEVLELLTPRPMATLNASVAPIFRSIQSERPTLLMDEVDAIFGRSVKSDDPAADLRALLNAGHRKGATIPRCVGPQHDVKRFPVYAAVALAGLGDLPDTLMSRAVIIRMRRRAPGEKIESFRHRVNASEGEQLRDRLAGWAETITDQVADAWPSMPDGVTDRAADCWEPLLAVADEARGHWPATARDACIELCKVAASRDASLGVRLLADLRTVFGGADTLPTETILDRLHKITEAPWADLRGKPLDARGLARRLRAYQVTSMKVWDGRPLQGYRAEDMFDAWTRYLPSLSGEAEGPEGAEDPSKHGPSSPPFADPHPDGTVPNGRTQANESGQSSAPSGPSASEEREEERQPAKPSWPLCSVCGREMYTQETQERGVCAVCVRVEAKAAETPTADTEEPN